VESGRGRQLSIPVSTYAVSILGCHTEFYSYTTKAFGQIVAKAAKITIVEAENIVPVGEIHPDNVDVQGIYVDRIVPATAEKTVEIRKLRAVAGQGADAGKKSDAQVRRERIAKRTAKELKHGYYVNLGVGESIMDVDYGQN
jgi:3-oxoacid CoA-transferase